MDQRKGDPRIYIITLLFLSCILSGGVLLGLYLLLSNPNPLFLKAGMVFVGVPWLFWFLAYVYSCLLKPLAVSVFNKSVSNFDPEKGQENNNNNTVNENHKNVSEMSPPLAMNSPREGEKKEQFGNVVVLGDEEEGSSNNLIQNHPKIEEEEEQENQEKGKFDSRSDGDDDECDKTPLRLSVGNK